MSVLFGARAGTAAAAGAARRAGAVVFHKACEGVSAPLGLTLRGGGGPGGPPPGGPRGAVSVPGGGGPPRALTTVGFDDPGGPLVPLGGLAAVKLDIVQMLVEVLWGCLQGVAADAFKVSGQTGLADTAHENVAGAVCQKLAEGKTADVRNLVGKGAEAPLPTSPLSFVPPESRPHYQARIMQLAEQAMRDRQLFLQIQRAREIAAQRRIHRLMAAGNGGSHGDI